VVPVRWRVAASQARRSVVRTRPNHARLTRPSRHCCNRGVPRAGSLSLSRWPKRQ
jgi:hypothetical protein